MIEAVMFWNEPNNMSHWDFEIDPGWQTFARDGQAGRRRDRAPRTPALPRVLGGISPIDPISSRTHDGRACSTHVDVGRRARLSARLESLADSTNGRTSWTRSAP